jgi:C4-dicarboxylate transporter, DctQ subunit
VVHAPQSADNPALCRGVDHASAPLNEHVRIFRIWGLEGGERLDVINRVWLALLKTSEGVCAALTLAMAVILVYEVVARTVFNAPTIWVQEVAVYMLLALAFIGLAATSHVDEHVRVDLLTRKLNARVRQVLEILICAAVAGFACIALWGGWDMALQSFRFGRRSLTLLSVPQWLPQLLLPVGMGLFVLALTSRISSLVRGLRREKDR